MRTIIYTVALCIMSSVASFGQSYGVKIGFNTNNPDIEGVGNVSNSQAAYTGFTGGVFAEFPMTQQLSFSSGVNYSQKGFGVDQTTFVNVFGIDAPVGVMVDTKINYVELPLAVKYRWGNEKAGVYAMAGPKLSYATDASVTAKARLIIDFNVATYDLNLDDDMYNRFELGGVVGIGGDVAAGAGSFFADLSYNQSFSNILHNPIIDLSIKNKGIAVNAGYKMSF